MSSRAWQKLISFILTRHLLIDAGPTPSSALRSEGTAPPMKPTHHRRCGAWVPPSILRFSNGYSLTESDLEDCIQRDLLQEALAASTVMRRSSMRQFAVLALAEPEPLWP